MSGWTEKRANGNIWHSSDCECVKCERLLRSEEPMPKTTTELRDALNELDSQIKKRIDELEAWLFELRVGIPVPLGDDFVWDKLNGKWRLMESGDDGRMMDNLPRDERVAFIEAWPQDNIEKQVRIALRAAIAHRKKVLG